MKQTQALCSVDSIDRDKDLMCEEPQDVAAGARVQHHKARDQLNNEYLHLKFGHVIICMLACISQTSTTFSHSQNISLF